MRFSYYDSIRHESVIKKNHVLYIAIRGIYDAKDAAHTQNPAMMGVSKRPSINSYPPKNIIFQCQCRAVIQLDNTKQYPQQP